MGQKEGIVQAVGQSHNDQRHNDQRDKEQSHQQVHKIEHEQVVQQLVTILEQQFPGQQLKHVQTHISTILLIADKAYKLKKPLKLPFLDFSSVEQRKFFSEEELRLNQRQCPALYKALHTLHINAQGSVEIDNPDLPIIDYMLEMQRFDADCEFAAMAKTGKLTASHIQALAKHLAHFHHSLPAVTQFDSDKRTADWARESFDEIAQHNDFQELPSAYHTSLTVWREQLLKRFQDWQTIRNQRRAQGYVRECHGDLHLGNIVVWQDQVLGFDALEFSRPLRTIDVIQDAAFVFMDLYAYDLAPMAWEFINTYLEETGDYKVMPLLLMYAAYKALVRAKVALLSHQPSDFERYWRTLQNLMHQVSITEASTVKLILMLGLSGSGKSVAARLISQQIAAVRLRSDAERKRLHREGQLVDEQGEPVALYSKQASTLTNQRMDALSVYLMQQGFSLVLDTVSPFQGRREFIRQLALERQANFYVVRVHASEQRLIERLEKRAAEGLDISDATKEVMLEQKQIMQDLPTEWQEFSFTLNNEGSLAQLAQQVSLLSQQLR